MSKSMPFDIELPKSDFSPKERLVVILILFIINLLKPWKYSHEQKEFFDDIYTILGLRSTKK